MRPRRGCVAQFSLSQETLCNYVRARALRAVITMYIGRLTKWRDIHTGAFVVRLPCSGSDCRKVAMRRSGPRRAEQLVRVRRRQATLSQWQSLTDGICHRRTTRTAKSVSVDSLPLAPQTAAASETTAATNTNNNIGRKRKRSTDGGAAKNGSSIIIWARGRAKNSKTTAERRREQLVGAARRPARRRPTGQRSLMRARSGRNPHVYNK